MAKTTSSYIPGYDRTYDQAWHGTHLTLRRDMPKLLAALARIEARQAAMTSALGGVDEAVVAGVLASLKEQIVALAPVLAAALAERMDDLTPEMLSDAMESAMREVFGSLDNPA